jgi:AraC family transcriptional regulator
MQSKAEYSARINRVLDYIEARLDQPLPLEDLARVACFSPFHFHRIFSAMTGETLGSFIQRLRLERAAAQLVHNSDKSITAVALDCGFSSSAVFARAFRGHFGMSASDWRAGGHRDRKDRKAKSNQGQPPGNGGKAIEVTPGYLDPTTHTMRWRIEMRQTDRPPLKADVEIRELDPMPVAYLRHVGPYAGDAALFQRLWTTMMKWAGPRGLFRPPETKMLSVYHDDPEVTDPDKLRLSICITVPEETETEGDIGRMTLAGGTYAVARFQITPDRYGDAWAVVYGGWLPESGYQPDDRLAFEHCIAGEEQTGDGTHIVEINVPVKPL